MPNVMQADNNPSQWVARGPAPRTTANECETLRSPRRDLGATVEGSREHQFRLARAEDFGAHPDQASAQVAKLREERLALRRLLEQVEHDLRLELELRKEVARDPVDSCGGGRVGALGHLVERQGIEAPLAVRTVCAEPGSPNEPRHNL